MLQLSSGVAMRIMFSCSCLYLSVALSFGNKKGENFGVQRLYGWMVS